jgi:hypothetical protein
MGNTRNTGFLQNAVKIADNGDISLMHGNTMLMQISSSGAITTTGVISGSNALSASYAATSTSSSYALSSTSASYAVASTSSSYAVSATSASYALSATTASFANSLTVAGTLTAQTLVVQTITSSVSTITGSTQFGSTGSNTHVFTGSVNLTGSLTVVTTGTELQVNASGVNLGNALTDSHIISGSLRVNPNGLFVSSSGIVGIGTTNPSTLLDLRLAATDNVTGSVSSSYAIASFVVNGSGGGQRGLQIGGPTGGISSPVFLKVFGTGQRFAVLNESNVENFTVTSAGNVGIGTITPTGTYGKLTVAGGIQITNDNAAKLEIGRYSSGAPNSYIKIGTNSNSLRITNAADSADIFSITNSGSVSIGTADVGYKLFVSTTSTGALNLNAANCTVGAPMADFYDTGRSQETIITSTDGSTTGTYIASYSNHPLLFGANAGASPTAKMTLTSGGALAIGTSTVTYSNYKFQARVLSDRNLAIGYQGTDVSIEAYNDAVSASVPLRIYGNNISLIGGAVLKPNNPAFRAWYSVNSFWNINSMDTFIFDTTEYNIGSCYNTSNGRFTASVAGVYRFDFYSIVYGAMTNGAISLRKNGGAPTSGYNMHFSPSTSGAWSNVVYTTSLYLNAGDYIYMINSGAYTQFHGDDWSSFSGYLVG